MLKSGYGFNEVAGHMHSLFLVSTFQGRSWKASQVEEGKGSLHLHTFRSSCIYAVILNKYTRC